MTEHPIETPDGTFDGISGGSDEGFETTSDDFCVGKRDRDPLDCIGDKRRSG